MCTNLFWYAAACSKVSWYGCSYDAPHAGHMHCVTGIWYDGAHEFCTGVAQSSWSHGSCGEKQLAHVGHTHGIACAYDGPHAFCVGPNTWRGSILWWSLRLHIGETCQLNVHMCMKSQGVRLSEWWGKEWHTFQDVRPPTVLVLEQVLLPQQVPQSKTYVCTKKRVRTWR